MSEMVRPSEVNVGDVIRWAGHTVQVMDREIGKHRTRGGSGVGFDVYLTLRTSVAGDRRCHWHATEQVERVHRRAPMENPHE